MTRERVPENLKKKLALAVRSIQWSYAIFWSTSARHSGEMLEWGEGYYNGDIKTRKTVQSMELDYEQAGLQRSEQLRELYESLSGHESNNPQARRPSVSLSPEDLTDTEWYYLVCMSFAFNIGQGLPGRTLANGEPIWLCNAHFADSKVFSRSLLAKSASIQTIVCFPYFGGVLELGVTELVLEDPDLISHLKTSFLEVPCSIGFKNVKCTVKNIRKEDDILYYALDHETLESDEQEIASLDNSCNGLVGPFMVEGINGAASHAQSWQFMDDEFSNCVLSMNSSDCISQTFIETEKIASIPHGENINEYLPTCQGKNETKLPSLDLRNDDLHYQSILSSLLKSSPRFILGPHSQNCAMESSFINWKKKRIPSFQKPKGTTPQSLLKRILFEVPRMHSCGFPATSSEADEIGVNNALSEKKRREKLNERFFTLRSLVPSIRKEDKVSILDEAIDYVKELERRVEELESSRELTEIEARTKRRLRDRVETTSNSKKKPFMTKRKSFDVINDSEYELDPVTSSCDVSGDDVINVCISNRDVLIEIRCPSREGVLLEIMDVVSNLRLDSHSVRSSVSDGVLSLTIKSKFNMSSVTSAGIIKQAIERIARKC